MIWVAPKPMRASPAPRWPRDERLVVDRGVYAFAAGAIADALATGRIDPRI